MTVKFLFICVLSASLGINLSAATPLPSKEKLHLYLLIGQSNMEGQGKIEPMDEIPHPRVLMFDRKHQWLPAVEPVTSRAKPNGYGVGPGLAFGKFMAEKNPDVTIGLVSCAVGGTPLKRWVRGGDLYANAVKRIRIAMVDGTLAGILWHQGEADSKVESDATTYGDRLAKMIHDLREDLNATNVPFVVGEIGQFNDQRTTKFTPYFHVVNDSLMKIPTHVPLTGCAESKGLTDKGDHVHFDSPSQRELGKRYAEIMLKLQAIKP